MDGCLRKVLGALRAGVSSGCLLGPLCQVLCRMLWKLRTFALSQNLELGGVLVIVCFSSLTALVRVSCVVQWSKVHVCCLFS